MYKKSLVTLFILFFISNLHADEMLVLLVNKSEKQYAAVLEAQELKKCRFPSGPRRYNKINDEDLININQNQLDNLEEHGIEVSILCIHKSPDAIDYECGIETSNGNLSYVFEFKNSQIQVIKCFLLSYDNSKLIFSSNTQEDLEDDFEIDVVSDMDDLDDVPDIKEIKPKPSKFKVILAKLNIIYLVICMKFKYFFYNNLNKLQSLFVNKNMENYEQST